MNNQEINLNESVLTEGPYFTEFTFTQNKNQVLCSFDKPAILACMNKNCNKNSFLCFEQQCKCIKQHDDCLKITLKSLIKKVESKKVFIDSLEICLNDRIEGIIDLLSEYRDEAISKIRKDFQFFGLNESQVDLLREVQNGKCEKTTGSKVWDIIHSELQKEGVKKIVEETCTQLQEHFKISKQSFQQTVKKAALTFDSLNFQTENLFFGSKASNYQKQNYHNIVHWEGGLNSSQIMTSLKQFSTILNFFQPKKIKQAKLIFRASQNDFSGKIFHQKCNGIPDTLVFVQTEFGKKIGGYTPIKWGSHQSGVWVKDDSMTSFIFSLTNGDKFQLTNREKAVLHYSNDYGAIFGQSTCDLAIHDKANQSNTSFANINNSYKNDKYQYQDKKSWESFCGNPCDKSFKVKQWQVWSLQFQ